MGSIEFWGACETVTGSKIVISSKNKKVMLDCGMYQGRRDEAYLKNKEFAEDVPKVDDCILSHAHIDHSGMLPALTKSGYTGNIYATPPTTQLCKHMLKDSVSVFTKELPIISRILKKNRDKTKVLPVYEEKDVEKCLSQFKSIDYNKNVDLNNEISFKFYDSCHILGSASIEVSVNTNNVKSKVFYTSDLGHDHSILSEEPKVPQDIDYLIIESTYGNKERQKGNDIYQEIADHINDAYKRGGKVIIPAFSVARMQSIILIISKLYSLDMIPSIPVYVDSPLGIKVTSLYEEYADTINEHTMKFFKDNNIDPFHYGNIKYVSSNDESVAVTRREEPCIIISASGMLEGGRVREHVKCAVGDKNSTVLFVGYTAVGTLGRRLYENNGQVTIDGKSYRVRCKTESVSGLSAHCDLSYLINYIEQCSTNNDLEAIFLVHGDVDAIKNVKHILNNYGITNVIIPKLYEKYNIN